MFNKTYETIKKFIKENYKSIIFFSILYFLVLCPVDYYIITGGGTVNVDDRVEIKNAYKSKGSLNLAYVSQLKGTIFTWALSYIMPSWERENIADYKIEENETKEDIAFRDSLELDVANENAIKEAYTKAKKKVKIKDTHLYVIYVEKHNKGKIKVGDELLEVKGNKISSFEDLREVINSCSENEKIKIKVKRNKKEIEKEIEVFKEKGELLIGVMVERLDEYKTNPKIKFNFKSSESGPSGGLLLTLDIYNKLTKKDITKGLKIVGTGTIERDGTVGEIGGVKYKLMGAVKAKADIFIVPSGDNYKEAIKYKKENNYDIKIIEADNFENVIKKLKNL